MKNVFALFEMFVIDASVVTATLIVVGSSVAMILFVVNGFVVISIWLVVDEVVLVIFVVVDVGAVYSSILLNDSAGGRSISILHYTIIRNPVQ